MTGDDEQRLDQWLAEHGLATGMPAARAAVEGGHITVNGDVAVSSSAIVHQGDVACYYALSHDRAGSTARPAVCNYVT